MPLLRRRAIAKDGDIARVVKSKLTCRRRDLIDLQSARHRRAAIISERIDLLTDQQHALVEAKNIGDFLRRRRKLTAEPWMQGIDRALHVEWCSIDVSVESCRNSAQGVKTVRGPDRIVRDNGQ